jgi:serine/threonine protein kinase
MLPGIQPLLDDDPREFGGWKIEGLIGEGGFSRIFLGSKNGQLAALKMLKKDFLNVADTFSRFAQEIANLKLLNHPNIAKYIEHDISTEVPYLATEYIPGPTLDDFVELNGPVTGNQWFDLASSLGRTLDFCHSTGVIHKDVSPSNIVIGDRGPVFIDFGLSKLEGDPDKSSSGPATGTFPFMAPEHLGSDRDPAMDSFSLAGTLIFAGTGHYPFFGKTNYEWMGAIRFDPPNFIGLTKTQIDLLTPLLYKTFTERMPLSSFVQFVESLKSGSPLPDELQSKLNVFLINSEGKLILERLGASEKANKPRKKIGIFALASVATILSIFFIWAGNGGDKIENATILTPKVEKQTTEILVSASESSSPKVEKQTTQIPTSADQPSTPTPAGMTSNDCEELFLANSKDALAACKTASDKNDDRSTYYLAAIYDNRGNKKDAETYYLKAVKLYKDDTKSMLGLVQIYLDRKDLKNYQTWVEKCANYQIKTTSGARCKLLYGMDQVGAGKTKIGIAYLSDSFDWGNVSAGTFLAKYYDEIEKDKSKALIWYEKAAEEGDPEAQKGAIVLSYELGKMDIWKKWITKSANGGNVTDIGKLALYLTIGDKNYVEGKKWGLIGGKAGDATSMFAAGYSYYKGDKNLVEAKNWLLKSANLNYYISARVLGEIYRSEKNSTESVIWYKKAALNDDIASTYQLAMIYLNDFNNPLEACNYFRSTLAVAEKLKKLGDFVESSDQKYVDNSRTGIATFCS